jgi:hypothetical protein
MPASVSAFLDLQAAVDDREDTLEEEAEEEEDISTGLRCMPI